MNQPMEKSVTQALPLSRITVLDLTLARAGPTCVRHLADWGANIIRIEPAEVTGEDLAGKREGFDFQNLHRNKKMVRLNLKSAEGHAAFMKLVEKADVIIENMRAEVKHRLKVAYDDVKTVNPRIVYGSISGVITDANVTQTVVPEPSTFVMSSILLGMFGAVWARKRLKRPAAV